MTINKFRKRGAGRIFRLFVFLSGALAGGVQAQAKPAAPVIAAYQEAYAMNFQVCRMTELPPGWYATFDGYPVAQVAPNRWVYGVKRRGSIAPAEVLVGAVTPMDVPELARMPVYKVTNSVSAPVSLWSAGACGTKAFQSIALSGFDNMGELDDPLAYTPVAWKTGVAELRIWLGNKWHSIVPTMGQSALKALLVRHPYIVRALRKKNAVWTSFDTQILADLAREWGYIWRGHVPFTSLRMRPNDYAPNGGSSASDAFAGAGGVSGGSGGEWDIGNENSGSGSGGGGWDTGSGGNNGNNSNTGGGWDK